MLFPGNGKTRLIRSEELFLPAKFKDMQHEERQIARDVVDDYEPCCDWIMHPVNKALRSRIIAGARRVHSSKVNSKGPRKFTHKYFAFVPDKDGKTSAAYFHRTKEKKVSTNEMKSDNIPNSQKTTAFASTFPGLCGGAEAQSSQQELIAAQEQLARQAIDIIDKISPAAPTPKRFAEAMASRDADEWAKAFNAEVSRHTDDLSTRTLEETLEQDRPLS